MQCLVEYALKCYFETVVIGHTTRLVRTRLFVCPSVSYYSMTSDPSFLFRSDSVSYG